MIKESHLKNVENLTKIRVAEFCLHDCLFRGGPESLNAEFRAQVDQASAILRSVREKMQESIPLADDQITQR